MYIEYKNIDNKLIIFYRLFITCIIYVLCMNELKRQNE